MESELDLKEVTRKKLASDLMTVIRDGADVLKAASARTNREISGLYQCIGTKLHKQQNPWISVGLSVGVGVALGWMVRRQNNTAK